MTNEEFDRIARIVERYEAASPRERSTWQKYQLMELDILEAAPALIAEVRRLRAACTVALGVLESLRVEGELWTPEEILALAEVRSALGQS